MALMINGKKVVGFALGSTEFYSIDEHSDGSITFNGHLYEDLLTSHNIAYRGKDLGAFTDSYASALSNDSDASALFTDMYIGDTFTQNGHTYKIGGFNYLLGADHNEDLPPHLLMITDVLTNMGMNSSATTSGGFAGTDMWKSYFPTIVQQLKADFGNHLLTWNEYLTTGTDGNSGAANQGDFFPVQASMMNSVMYWGSPSQYSTPFNGKNYNIGIETKQLPIMQLHPDEQNNNGNYAWLRDVYNSQDFAFAKPDGTPGSHRASGNGGGVRAFFLIG